MLVVFLTIRERERGNVEFSCVCHESYCKAGINTSCHQKEGKKERQDIHTYSTLSSMHSVSVTRFDLSKGFISLIVMPHFHTGLMHPRKFTN